MKNMNNIPPLRPLGNLTTGKVYDVYCTALHSTHTVIGVQTHTVQSQFIAMTVTLSTQIHDCLSMTTSSLTTALPQ